MRYDVIIIGAGAAGLAAARTLSGARKRICILEARDRTGGRVHSLHLPDLPLPIELGAEFIHGGNAGTFSIVDAAALAVAELPDDHWWSEDGQWERIEDFWGQIDRVRAKITARRRDVPFAEFLRAQRNLSPRLRELARSFVEGYHAAHADRMSTLVLRKADGEQDDDNRQFRIAQGQDALIEWLRAGIDPQHAELRLGSVVTRVEWSRGSVAVGCTRGPVIRAKKLIVTIPVGVWKAPPDQEGAIRFDPPLRDKERALEKIEAGHVVKIAFRFRERFWEERGNVNFLHSADRFMPTWWTTAPFRSPLITGWAGGPAADELLSEGADAVADRTLEALSRAWCVPRRRLDALLVGTFVHDWQRDPFSRCAYSYAAVGGQQAHAALARPVQKTLFFAGEATSGDETGTVSGAIESGIRAAREALRE